MEKGKGRWVRLGDGATGDGRRATGDDKIKEDWMADGGKGLLTKGTLQKDVNACNSIDSNMLQLFQPQ